MTYKGSIKIERGAHQRGKSLEMSRAWAGDSGELGLDVSGDGAVHEGAQDLVTSTMGAVAAANSPVIPVGGGRSRTGHRRSFVVVVCSRRGVPKRNSCAYKMRKREVQTKKETRGPGRLLRR